MTNKTHPEVLIVDDSAAIRLMLSAALKAKGFLVETASSGEAALEMVQNRVFGLVLIDLLMPGMDGLELCQNLSSHPKRSEFKVVICSGCDEIEVIQNTMKAGADAYFTKEGGLVEFSNRLSALFEGMHARVPASETP